MIMTYHMKHMRALHKHVDDLCNYPESAGSLYLLNPYTVVGIDKKTNNYHVYTVDNK